MVFSVYESLEDLVGVGCQSSPGLQNQSETADNQFWIQLSFTLRIQPIKKVRKVKMNYKKMFEGYILHLRLGS